MSQLQYIIHEIQILCLSICRSYSGLEGVGKQLAGKELHLVGESRWQRSHWLFGGPFWAINGSGGGWLTLSNLQISIILYTVFEIIFEDTVSSFNSIQVARAWLGDSVWQPTGAWTSCWGHSSSAAFLALGPCPSGHWREACIWCEGGRLCLEQRDEHHQDTANTASWEHGFYVSIPGMMNDARQKGPKMLNFFNFILWGWVENIRWDPGHQDQ